jgi:predicted nucleic acid-binding protein
VVTIEDFDEGALPQKALVDTGVLFRALGDRPADPRSPVSVAFMQAMLKFRRKIIVSTISFGEVLRGRPLKSQPPAVTGIELIAYDTRAAMELAQFPATQIREVVKGRDDRRLLLQDSMILASAIRHNVRVVVTFDGGLVALAQTQNLVAGPPDMFLGKQTSIPFSKE